MTLLQFGIEERTKDMETLWMTSYNNYVPYKNVYKQTVNFRSFMYGELMDMGMVIGHNTNFDNFSNDAEDEEKFAGAINGDSMLNSFNGVPIYGSPSHFLFSDVIDFDFSAIWEKWLHMATCVE